MDVERCQVSREHVTNERFLGLAFDEHENAVHPGPFRGAGCGRPPRTFFSQSSPRP